MSVKIGSIAAAIAALAVIAFMAPMFDIGTPARVDNASAATPSTSTPTTTDADSLVDWIKLILLLGIAGAVGAKVKGLF